jgi:hypothetical protein
MPHCGDPAIRAALRGDPEHCADHYRECTKLLVSLRAARFTRSRVLDARAGASAP